MPKIKFSRFFNWLFKVNHLEEYWSIPETLRSNKWLPSLRTWVFRVQTAKSSSYDLFYLISIIVQLQKENEHFSIFLTRNVLGNYYLQWWLVTTKLTSSSLHQNEAKRALACGWKAQILISSLQLNYLCDLG